MHSVATQLQHKSPLPSAFTPAPRLQYYRNGDFCAVVNRPREGILIYQCDPTAPEDTLVGLAGRGRRQNPGPPGGSLSTF